MRIIFQQHLDYVFFVYGLAFVLIAAICVVIPKESARGAPWKWLGLFGLVHGFAEWLEILAIDLTDTSAFGAVRVAAIKSKAERQHRDQHRHRALSGGRTRP